MDLFLGRVGFNKKKQEELTSGRVRHCVNTQNIPELYAWLAFSLGLSARCEDSDVEAWPCNTRRPNHAVELRLILKVCQQHPDNSVIGEQRLDRRLRRYAGVDSVELNSCSTPSSPGMVLSLLSVELCPRACCSKVRLPANADLMYGTKPWQSTSGHSRDTPDPSSFFTAASLQARWHSTRKQGYYKIPARPLAREPLQHETRGRERL